MSTAMNTIEVIHLDQPAAAIDKNLTIWLGWRPAMVMLFNWAADNDWIVALDTDVSGMAGGLKMPKDDTASAKVGADGIGFHARGITLGKDAVIKADNANLIIVAFRAISGVTKVTLSGLETTPSAYGKGTQFKKGASALSDQVRVTAD